MHALIQGLLTLGGFVERQEKLSYLVLFCSILAARKMQQSVSETSRQAPLAGGALRLFHLLEENAGVETAIQEPEPSAATCP